MVETLVRPDQRTDAVPLGGSTHARIWTLMVTCMGVSLVIASMVTLNTALPDVAVATATTQSQLTWVVDSYTLVLACLLLPAGAGARSSCRDPFPADVGVLTRRAHQGGRSLGRRSRLRRRHWDAWVRPAAPFLFVALDLLGLRRCCGPDLCAGVYGNYLTGCRGHRVDWPGAALIGSAVWVSCSA